jgi:hypothetical protein
MRLIDQIQDAMRKTLASANDLQFQRHDLAIPQSEILQQPLDVIKLELRAEALSKALSQLL